MTATNTYSFWLRHRYCLQPANSSDHPVAGIQPPDLVGTIFCTCLESLQVRPCKQHGAIGSSYDSAGLYICRKEVVMSPPANNQP